MRTAACLLFLSGVALAQPAADTFDPRSRDEAHVARLSGDNGASATAGRVTVYVPAGALSGEELTALAEKLNRGFTGLVAFTHSPRSWQRVPSNVSYYFHAEMLISHADPERDRLFIAFPRLQNGEAPLLHEAVHVLLSPSAEHLRAHPEFLDETTEWSDWLYEGIASYVGESVAAETGIVEGDPIGWGKLAEVDARCATASSTPVGAEVLPFIGAPGIPAALLSRSRRLEVAPPFYACATSFTKFLVAAIGIDAVLDSMSTPASEDAIAAAAGKSMDQLRADWRRAIGAN
jgi:hypothetical protein